MFSIEKWMEKIDWFILEWHLLILIINIKWKITILKVNYNINDINPQNCIIFMNNFTFIWHFSPPLCLSVSVSVPFSLYLIQYIISLLSLCYNSVVLVGTANSYLISISLLVCLECLQFFSRSYITRTKRENVPQIQCNMKLSFITKRRLTCSQGNRAEKTSHRD